MAAAKKAAKTKTAGAIRAGNGKYQFRLSGLKKVPAGTGYSTSHGGVVEAWEVVTGIERAGEQHGQLPYQRRRRIDSHPG